MRESHHNLPYDVFLLRLRHTTPTSRNLDPVREIQHGLPNSFQNGSTFPVYFIPFIDLKSMSCHKGEAFQSGWSGAEGARSEHGGEKDEGT